MTPQLIITLTPDHQALQAELPGVAGTRRIVSLDPKQFYQNCIRMLQAQALRAEIAIGLDGAPTQAQLKHWEQHQDFPDSRCAFCRAEGRIRQSAIARAPRREIAAGDGTIKVRKFKAKARQSRDSKKSLEEMGL